MLVCGAIIYSLFSLVTYSGCCNCKKAAGQTEKKGRQNDVSDNKFMNNCQNPKHEAYPFYNLDCGDGFGGRAIDDVFCEID